MVKRKYALKPDEADERDFLMEYRPVKTGQLPTSIDLRDQCPEVYDQGSQGSCTAHAGCACRTMLAGDKTLDLSRAFLYYQERVLEGTAGQDAGASMRDICKATQKFGICKAEDMPYQVADFTTPPSAAAVQNAKDYKISDYRRILTLDCIRQSLVSRRQPVLIGMRVYESMETDAVSKTGILPMPGSGERELGRHAVLVVGYQDSEPVGFFRRFLNFLTGRCKSASSGYLIVRNSWGTEWGQQGYFQMPYEYLEKYAFDFWTME